MWIGIMFMFLYFRSTICEEPLYKKEGSEVVLTPYKTTSPISSILWKHGDNFAMEYFGNEIFPYLPFKERASLNPLNGEITITGLVRSDTGVYTVEINNQVNRMINLKVIGAVPKPDVKASCDPDYCNLTCVGDTVDAAPVSFIWIIGNEKPQIKDKEYRITKHLKAKFIRCELENPVSSQQSDKYSNPFLNVIPDPLKIIIGVVVPLILLGAVIVLLILHNKGIITIPFCKTQAPGNEVNRHRYEKAEENDRDAPNGPLEVATSADSAQTPNGNEPRLLSLQPLESNMKAEENDHDAPNGLVEQPGTSSDPTQSLNGTEVEVSADVHRNTGNDTGPSHENQTDNGHDSGGAPTSSDNHRNADTSNSNDKPDDDKSAPDKKPQEDEEDELGHIDS